MNQHPTPDRSFPRWRAAPAPRRVTALGASPMGATPVCDGCRRTGAGPWHAAPDGAQHCEACHAVASAAW